MRGRCEGWRGVMRRQCMQQSDCVHIVARCARSSRQSSVVRSSRLGAGRRQRAGTGSAAADPTRHRKRPVLTIDGSTVLIVLSKQFADIISTLLPKWEQESGMQCRQSRLGEPLVCAGARTALGRTRPRPGRALPLPPARLLLAREAGAAWTRTQPQPAPPSRQWRLGGRHRRG